MHDTPKQAGAREVDTEWGKERDGGQDLEQSLNEGYCLCLAFVGCCVSRTGNSKSSNE